MRQETHGSNDYETASRAITVPVTLIRVASGFACDGRVYS